MSGAKPGQPGPGPSTQAGYALRATRRPSAISARSAEESEGGPAPKRQKREDDEGEDEIDLEDEDDSEYDEDGNQKEPVFHWQIWRQLLKKGSWHGLLRYTNQQPLSGDHPLNVTAPHQTQITWDLENRSLWPPRLLLWQRPDDLENPTYDVGVMRYKGHVVLDTSEEPIRDFRIPLTICSRVEGLRIEAWMRADNRLTLGDIEARLWTKDVPGVGRRPFFGRRALSKRASLDRCKAGLISWLEKKGRDAHTGFMDNLRTPEQRANNRVIDQNLTGKQRADYTMLGLNQSKQSNAPTRAERIRKIMRASGEDNTVAGSSSGPANTEPADPVAPASSEDDSKMNVDSDNDEPEPETQVPEQASENDRDEVGSISSNLTDPFDSRHEPPTNAEEIALLRHALEVTVEDFSDLAGQQPVLANPDDNYYSQWGILQQQFKDLWAARGNTTEAPLLKGRGRWTDGISQFEFAEIERGPE